VTSEHMLFVCRIETDLKEVVPVGVIGATTSQSNFYEKAAALPQIVSGTHNLACFRPQAFE
jgi:hypothetical protein